MENCKRYLTISYCKSSSNVKSKLTKLRRRNVFENVCLIWLYIYISLPRLFVHIDNSVLVLLQCLRTNSSAHFLRYWVSRNIFLRLRWSGFKLFWKSYAKSTENKLLIIVMIIIEITIAIIIIIIIRHR